MAEQQAPEREAQAPQARNDHLMAHSYDGIQEYDNPLPAWWTWTFAATVVFTAWYILYFHIGVGPSIYDQYDEAVAAHLEQLLEGIDLDAEDDATLLALVADGEKASAMSGVFKTNCANCHRDDAGGNVGPNLTDGHWINATSPTEVMDVIRQGQSSKGMPAWGDRLRPAQVLLLTAYLGTLRGTRPADPKEPEGEAVDVWVAQPSPSVQPAPDEPAEPTGPAEPAGSEAVDGDPDHGAEQEPVLGDGG